MCAAHSRACWQEGVGGEGGRRWRLRRCSWRRPGWRRCPRPAASRTRCGPGLGSGPAPSPPGTNTPLRLTPETTRWQCMQKSRPGCLQRLHCLIFAWRSFFASSNWVLEIKTARSHLCLELVCVLKNKNSTVSPLLEGWAECCRCCPRSRSLGCWSLSHLVRGDWVMFLD